MPINPSNAPAAAVRAVHRALVSRAARRTFSLPNLRRADLGALSISMPHRVAYLPLDRIQRGIDIRKAASVRSWRFLVHEKKRRGTADDAGVTETEEYLPIAAATAAMVGAERYEVGDLNEGPFVEGTEKAIGVAEKLEMVRKGNFEALLLIVPALYVVALWLQDRDGGTDIVLTIPPSNSALAPYHPIAPSQFLEILVRLAA